MASATLNIRVSPRRMLAAREAAEYCGLSLKRFPVECSAVPIDMPGGTKLYDMRDQDAWIDGLKTGAANHDDAILSRLTA